MKIFVTGATGYIGGSLAEKLRDSGHQVLGLVRSAEKARLLKERGIEPIIGTLDDADILREAVAATDGVIDAASADHQQSIETLISALQGSGKPLIRTSGSSIICDDARGDYLNPVIYTEDSYFEPIPSRVDRVKIDRYVREAGIYKGIRSIVICPGMIYGTGRGLQPDSDQIPKLAQLSKQAGAGLYIGKGLNRYSNVYLDDLMDLYVLALESAPGASFFYAENGESSLKDVAVSISNSLGLAGKTQSLDADEVTRQFGDMARYGLASNSRVSSVNARRTLQWHPKGPSLADAVENPSNYNINKG